MRPDLTRALEQLYRCFPASGDIGDLEDHSCPHCNLGDRIQPLLTDRSVIDAEALVFYSGRAISTCGTVEHFKHFLPRLLETCDAIVWGGPPLDRIGFKLASAEWRTWPPGEVEAVTSTLLAILDGAVADRLRSAMVDCSEILTQSEWIDWLSTLDGDDLATVVTDFGRDFLVTGGPPRYLDDMKRLDERLGPGRLRATLETSFFSRADDDDASALSNVHRLLDHHGVTR